MPLVEIAQFHNPVEAEIARAGLEAAGIGAVLFDAGLSSVYGGAVQPARLMVDESQEREARALLPAA